MTKEAARLVVAGRSFFITEIEEKAFDNFCKKINHTQEVWAVGGDGKKTPIYTTFPDGKYTLTETTRDKMAAVYEWIRKGGEGKFPLPLDSNDIWALIEIVDDGGQTPVTTEDNKPTLDTDKLKIWWLRVLENYAQNINSVYSKALNKLKNIDGRCLQYEFTTGLRQRLIEDIQMGEFDKDALQKLLFLSLGSAPSIWKADRLFYLPTLDDVIDELKDDLQ